MQSERVGTVDQPSVMAPKGFVEVVNVEKKGKSPGKQKTEGHLDGRSPIVINDCGMIQRSGRQLFLARSYLTYG